MRGWFVCLSVLGLATPLSAGLPTSTPSPNPTLLACTGNCDGNEAVSIDELLRGVNIALEQADVAECGRFDADGNSRVTVDELVQGVSNALFGCGVTPPTPEPSATPTPTSPDPPTATFTSIPLATATPTPTPIFTSTRTASPMPTQAISICGGPITTTPNLCTVEVVPNPVPLFGQFAISFCLSDSNGDLLQYCRGIRTGMEIPDLTCVPIAPTGQIINGCFQVGPFASTNPAGNYTLIFRVDDQLSSAGPVAVPFAVR